VKRKIEHENNRYRARHFFRYCFGNIIIFPLLIYLIYFSTKYPATYFLYNQFLLFTLILQIYYSHTLLKLYAKANFFLIFLILDCRYSISFSQYI